MEHNMVGWFEIPVTDMDRAKKFYETVFDVQIQVQNFGELIMAWFPFADNKMGSSGTLVKHDSYIPSKTDGVLIYFSCADLALELGRVEDAGGKIIQSKTQISPEYGYMAVINDTEGNRIALHSMK